MSKFLSNADNSTFDNVDSSDNVCRHYLLKRTLYLWLWNHFVEVCQDFLMRKSLWEKLTQQVPEELPICWVGQRYRASKYTNYIIDEMSKSDKNQKILWTFEFPRPDFNTKYGKSSKSNMTYFCLFLIKLSLDTLQFLVGLNWYLLRQICLHHYCSHVKRAFWGQF